MSVNPPVNHRLEKLLKEGTTDLEAALAESTDLDANLSAALEAGASQLTRVLKLAKHLALRLVLRPVHSVLAMAHIPGAVPRADEGRTAAVRLLHQLL